MHTCIHACMHIYICMLCICITNIIIHDIWWYLYTAWCLTLGLNFPSNALRRATLGDPLTLPPASNRRPCCTGLWLVERDATTKWTTNRYIVVNGDGKHGRCWRAHGIPRRGKPTYFLHIWRQHPSQNLLKGTFTVDASYLTGRKHMLLVKMFP